MPGKFRYKMQSKCTQKVELKYICKFLKRKLLLLSVIFIIFGKKIKKLSLKARKTYFFHQAIHW